MYNSTNLTFNETYSFRSVHLPVDNGIFQETDSSLEENSLPDLETPYLPPYFNPSRHPIDPIQNSSDSSESTFEIFFHFTPSFSNVLILLGLVTCTVWVIVMNLLIISALLKGHSKNKEDATHMYLINLLFADVLLGVFVFPFMSIVILIGYFPLSALWCNLWVYFDYYLIIASSYGFAALMTSYLLILRWPEYYPISRKLHFIFIVMIWIISNAPWTAPFINDRVFVLYPRGICGFSIQKNRYFTFYIGFTGFYVPLVIALLAGIFAVKYLKQTSRASIFKLLMNSYNCHVQPFDSSPVTNYSVFNDLQFVRRGSGRWKVQSTFVPPQSIVSTHNSTSESTKSSDLPLQKKRNSVMSITTFRRTKKLQESVKRHFPLVATNLILFVGSRSLFYTYFWIGSVIPKLFPPDLSHLVYWVMHSYAVLAPVFHLMLDHDLRRSVARFLNEGTFELRPFEIATTTMVATKPNIHQQHFDHGLPKVSVIENHPSLHHHHHHHYHHHDNLHDSVTRVDNKV